MVEVVLEKEACDGCGVDVRQGTLFCYNCGMRVAGDEPKVAGDVESEQTGAESAETVPESTNNGHSPDDADKLAAAATERKRSRVAHRKTAEYVWEPTTGEGAGLTFLVAIIIAVFALVVVLLMVNW